MAAAATAGLVLALLVQAITLSAPRRHSAVHRWQRRRAAARDDDRSARIDVLTAVAVGVGLRLVWVVLATETPAPFEDAAEYLRTAQGFLDGDLPTFRSGAPSAMWAPGYPLLLSPFLGVANATGWAGPTFVASLVNVAGGGVTIALSAVLAGQWISPRARVPAAWLVALTPALVYWTATAHTESAFTPVFLAVMVLITRATDADDRGRWHWVAIGAMTGAAVLIRSPGIILLLVPLLATRGRTGSWRAGVKPTVLVLAGSCLLLVPWTVRNGVQVGVWTPGPTSNATGPCLGHHPDARPQFTDPTDQLLEDCFRGSPFDDPVLEEQLRATGDVSLDVTFGEPDEGEWYRRTLTDTVGWVVQDPLREVPLTAAKVWETWEDEHRVVEVSRAFATDTPTWSWTFRLNLLANLWLWLLEALAVAGLVLVPACRRAWPLWGLILAMTVLIAGGVAYPNYRYPVLPLVAVLGAGTLARGWRPPAGDGRGR